MHARAKPGSLARTAAEIAGPCAAFAIVFGVLFGEFFGDIARRTLGVRPLLLDREQAVFALSQRPRDEGVPALISVARTNKDPEIRKKALFWLGQSHDPRALDLFEELLTKK